MPCLALVDDNANVVGSLRLALRMYGLFDTIPYTDPRDLLRDLQQGLAIDLVITDYFMPGLTGVQLLDSIHGLCGKIPGIIVTANPECVEPATPTGIFYPLLYKGRDTYFRDLVEMVEGLLSGQRTAARAEH